MLTQYEYNLLPVAKKADLLWSHGTHLLNRQSPPFTVGLYAVGDFFVEAYFSKSNYYEGNQELQHLLSIRMKDRHKLSSQYPFEHYLDQIDISMLIAK